jgi:3-methyl-2-oxobutanoate hydroxymethyltransferase
MRVSITQLQQMKKQGRRIVMVTVYDYSTARLTADTGIPVVLVGDSLGMVMLGYESTIPVTMDVMVHHTAAVVRGNTKSLIVGDMPFLSYRGSGDEALRNAGRLLQEAGKTPAAAARMLDDALALQDAGIFALVLETVPATLARIISERLTIPTIGIGAGPHCDGQVQVLHDLLGWYPDFMPKHARPYAQIGDAIREAFRAYSADVQSGAFPGPDQTIDVDPAVFAALEAAPDGAPSTDQPATDTPDPELRYGGAGSGPNR